MAAVSPPEGFSWVWADDTVRINLPWFVRTESHSYEPVLSTKDAQALAESIVANERKRRATGRERPLKRVLLAHDPRYATDTLTRFRAKLSIALVERGQAAGIDEMVTMSGLEAENDAGAAGR